MRLSLSQLKEGPVVLENLFADFIPRTDFATEGKLPWYKHLIAALKLSGPGFWKNDIIAYNFCLLYLYYQSTNYTKDQEEKESFLNAVILHADALAKPGKKHKELEYYAVFLKAIAMQMQEKPWSDVEAVFLHAYEVYPARGEALEQVIRHYLSSGTEAAIAYIYTTYLKDHVFEKLPVNDRWAMDPELYNWKILDLHTAACYGMGRIDEAADTYQGVIRLLNQKPDLFAPDQASHLREKEKYFIFNDDDSEEDPALHTHNGVL